MEKKSPWISPDMKPEIDKSVFIRLRNPATFESTKILHTVGYYAIDGTWWTDDGAFLRSEWIVSWMTIPE